MTLVREFVLWAAALALTTPACAIRNERIGDPRVLESNSRWPLGVTTLAEVARELGPPDEIRNGPGGLRFVYRASRSVERRFLLSYVLKLFTRETRETSARTVRFAFDDKGALISVTETASLDGASSWGSRPGGDD